MDIIADGLWAVVAAKAANKKLKKPINSWLAGFWGIFPDLFSFWIAMIWVLWGMAEGTMQFSDMPRHPDSAEQMPLQAFWVYQISYDLYNISHSAVVFFAIFFLTWIVLRKPHLELFGWFVHLLVDIPTHTLENFPTPLLWPLSEWKIDGLAYWHLNWFAPLTYIFIFFLLYLLRNHKKKKSN